MLKLARVFGVIALLVLLGTCFGAIWWAPDADSTTRPRDDIIYCFLGHIVGVDTATRNHVFAIRYLEDASLSHDSIGAPQMPFVLVCSRFATPDTTAKSRS